MNADLTQISVIASLLVAVFGVFWMVFTTRKLNRKLSQYEPDIKNITSLFRYEEDENGAPQIDARLVKIAEAFSSGVAKSIQGSIMGQLSGVKRMEKGLKGAMAKDIVQNKMPLLELIGDFLGINTLKYVEKHPDAMGQILQMAAPALQNIMGNNGSKKAASNFKKSFGR